MKSALHCWTIATKSKSLVVYVRKVMIVAFQENTLNGRRDRAEYILCCSWSEPFIIEQLQTKLTSLAGYTSVVLGVEFKETLFDSSRVITETVHGFSFKLSFVIER
jgi:hypothetical protein